MELPFAYDRKPEIEQVIDRALTYGAATDRIVGIPLQRTLGRSFLALLGAGLCLAGRSEARSWLPVGAEEAVLLYS